jgi:mRNA-capping enzyme
VTEKKKVFNVGNRFYHRKEVEELGAKYVKLQCRGHGETPSQEQVSAWERT